MLFRSFGQILKETGKRKLKPTCECYAVLFPSECAEWIDDKGVTHKRPDGVSYYRQGFSRIDEEMFKKFGQLVGLKYVFSFSSVDKKLDIYEWDSFPNKNSKPIQSLVSCCSAELSR